MDLEMWGHSRGPGDRLAVTCPGSHLLHYSCLNLHSHLTESVPRAGTQGFREFLARAEQLSLQSLTTPWSGLQLCPNLAARKDLFLRREQWMTKGR